MDCSPPGFLVHRIFQGRILEWVASSFSRGSSWPRGQTHISCVSCTGRWILYHRATWEAYLTQKQTNKNKPIKTFLRTVLGDLLQSLLFSVVGTVFGPAKLCMQPGMATGLKQAWHLRKDKKEERLEISSKKLEILREYFMQRWAQ